MNNKKIEAFDLKKGVDFIGVTCVFYCHDGRGNILLHRRSRNCRDEQGRWDCGSGSMEFGETFEETVRREIMEEYCVKPSKLTFCGAHNVIRMNGKQKTHWVAAVFVARVNPRKCRIGEPEKMDEIGWFNLKKLPKDLHSVFHRHLKTIRKAGIKL